MEVKQLIDLLPTGRSEKVNRILQNKCSTWLSIIPSNDILFAMSPDEFRDAMAL
jgi:hypothetical protein